MECDGGAAVPGARCGRSGRGGWGLDRGVGRDRKATEDGVRSRGRRTVPSSEVRAR